MRTVLVSGAGIAGPALAFWLHHHGFESTVVERAPAIRPGGQAVDVRGAALDVIGRMGLLPQLRAMRTRMRGMSVVDGTGVEVMRSTEEAWSSGRFDSPDVEVLRDDLAVLLSAHAPGTFVFGDSITALDQTGDRVRVTFARAEPRDVDLVIGADGLRSAVRRLAFGPDGRYVHHLGAYVGVFTAPNVLDLDEWQVWLRADGAGGAIYSARDNTEIRATLGFESPPIVWDRHDPDAPRRLLRERLAHLGGEIPRLLDAMGQAPDFYFDAMAQVRMPSWHTGRVALLGDAGYCPSPLSGQGTSLALVGAYVLAAAGDDHQAGFAAYDRRMRPFVELNQALATENSGGPPSPESVERAKNAITLS